MRFLAPWYICNALALLAYAVPRLWWSAAVARDGALPPYARARSVEEALNMVRAGAGAAAGLAAPRHRSRAATAQERALFLFACSLVAFKVLRRESYDGLSQSLVFYGKARLR